MVKRLRKFSALTPDQRSLFIEAWALFLKWDLLISMVPYITWRSSLASSSSSDIADTPASLPTIRTIIDISEIAARNHLRKMNCLRRCLCQRQLLSRRNINSQMHFGVVMEEGKLKAHCWLTYQGILINDTGEVVCQYIELMEIPERSIEAMLLKP